ncbi:hypothetical protein GCK32_006074 [Trichostrongylus colubriformis]|uniref:Arrestin C-terminal-like domain-containing protein n=1 Tax=Trichostrongylus colubriformis TaxID=6319 RepID=A0AAN8F8U8_TRICO
MDCIRVEISTDKDVYTPGQALTGSVNIFARKPVAIDSIKARLYGDAVVQFVTKDFYNFSNHRVFVNEDKELWHYSTLQEMLGMSTLDHNANRCEKGYLTGKSQFRFAFNLPCDLVTSFACRGSPVVVKYSITVTLNLDDEVLWKHEHPITVVAPQLIARPVGSQKVVHSRCFPLMKGRSLFIECVLEHAVLSSTDKVQATITITNRWKQSIKYVHISILKKIEAVGCFRDDHTITDTKTVLINTSGVGLPVSKNKIAIGETYSFIPNFNIPALPPSMGVPDLLQVSYMLDIAVGRAHNFVIASLKVPITIVTDIIDMEPVAPAQHEDLLIDLTPPNWKNTAPAIDLLA